QSSINDATQSARCRAMIVLGSSMNSAEAEGSRALPITQCWYKTSRTEAYAKLGIHEKESEAITYQRTPYCMPPCLVRTFQLHSVKCDTQDTYRVEDVLEGRSHYRLGKNR